MVGMRYFAQCFCLIYRLAIIIQFEMQNNNGDYRDFIIMKGKSGLKFRGFETSTVKTWLVSIVTGKDTGRFFPIIMGFYESLLRVYSSLPVFFLKNQPFVFSICLLNYYPSLILSSIFQLPFTWLLCIVKKEQKNKKNKEGRTL